MKCNDLGLDIIRSFEGLKLQAYRDGNGIPTIGYGHTAGVKMGDTCTTEQAEAWLVEDVAYAEKIVSDAVKVALNENQFSALCSFVYNIGPGKEGERDGFVVQNSGEPSSILKAINENDLASVPFLLLQWTHIGGAVSSGLVRRRIAEKQLYMRPI